MYVQPLYALNSCTCGAAGVQPHGRQARGLVLLLTSVGPMPAPVRYTWEPPACAVQTQSAVVVAGLISLRVNPCRDVCFCPTHYACCCCPACCTPQADAEALESEARALSGPDGLVPDASGSNLQKALAGVAAATADGTFAYNRFFAVGLFR